MAFHQRLKHERLVKGWTIEQLSQASGVTVNRISMLERNLVELVSDNLKACLAKALEVDFDAPPSVPDGAVQEAVPAVQTQTVEKVNAPVVPAPFALHLPTALQQQLEAAAHARGRSLHGEILERLEASLGNWAVAVPAAQEATHVTAALATQRRADGLIALSEADLAHIADLVAKRLQTKG